MTATTSLKTLIEDQVGLTADVSSLSNLEAYIAHGCNDVVRRIKAKQPAELHKFLYISNAITSGTEAGVSISQGTYTIKEIPICKRDGIACRPVNPVLKSELGTATSIHYATAKDPVFFITEGKIFVFPDAEVGEPVIYSYVPEWDVVEAGSAYNILGSIGGEDGGTAVANANHFPREFYEHVALFAAIQLLEVRIRSYLVDDEDVELINGAQAQLGSMKQRYELLNGGV